MYSKIYSLWTILIPFYFSLHSSIYFNGRNFRDRIFSQMVGNIRKNCSHKKNFHSLRTDKFPRKTFFKFPRKEFLAFSAKRKLPRKNISAKINTKPKQNILTHLRKTILSSQTISIFFQS